MGKRFAITIIVLAVVAALGVGFAIATLAGSSKTTTVTLATQAPSTSTQSPESTVSPASLPYQDCNTAGGDGSVQIDFYGHGANLVCQEWLHKQPAGILWLKRRPGLRSPADVCRVVDQGVHAVVYIETKVIAGGVADTPPLARSTAQAICSAMLRSGWSQERGQPQQFNGE